MIGNSGTNGTRKPRSRSGRVLRSTITPMLTITKANSVPMLTSSKMISGGTVAASTAMRTPKIAVASAGVCRRDTRPKVLGTRPSLDIEYMIRVWP